MKSSQKSFNYKICVYSNTPLYANVALVKYIRETGFAERPLIKHYQCKISTVTYIYTETIQAANAYIRFLQFAAKEYDAPSSTSYSIIERTPDGKLLSLVSSVSLR